MSALIFNNALEKVQKSAEIQTQLLTARDSELVLAYAFFGDYDNSKNKFSRIEMSTRKVELEIKHWTFKKNAIYARSIYTLQVCATKSSDMLYRPKCIYTV